MRTVLYASLFVSVGCDGLRDDWDDLLDGRAELGDGEAMVLRIDAPSQLEIPDLLGVNAGPLVGSDDLTAAYQELGVRHVRTHDHYGPLDMPMMFPNLGADVTACDGSDGDSYEFETSDRMFRAIQDGGFSPYLRIGESYCTGSCPPNPATEDERQSWADAAAKVIEHYHDGTCMMKDDEPLAKASFEYVEIGNEPTNEVFWSHSDEEFFDLYESTFTAIRAGYPDLKLGGPALLTGNPEHDDYAEAFVDHAAAAGLDLDFVSVHIYQDDPRRFVEYYEMMRDIVRSRYPSAELHLSEWSTADETLREDGNGLGAATLTAIWLTLLDSGWEKASYYKGVAEHSGTETPESDGPLWGLVQRDGSYRTSGYAFHLWSVFSEIEQRRLVHLESSAGRAAEADGVYFAAGQTADGDIAVLMANTSDESHPWEITGYSGVPVDRRLYTIDEHGTCGSTLGEPCTPEWVSDDQGEISAHTTQLMVIELD